MFNEILSFALKYMGFALLLGVGLTLQVESLRAALKRPRVVVQALIVIEVVIPLLTLGIVSFFDLAPRMTGILLLVSMCAGLPLLPKIAGKAGADMGMVLMLLIATALLAPVEILVWSAIFNRVTFLELDVTARSVLMVTVPSIIVPLALGFVLRLLVPRIAPTLARVAFGFFTAALIVALIGVIAIGGKTLVDLTAQDVLAMVLIVVASLFLGHSFGGPLLADKRAVAMVAVLGSPALALAIVAWSYPDVRVKPLVAAYVLMRFLILLPYMTWARRHPSAPTVEHPGDHAVPAT